MRTLVTGAAGFIGSTLVDRLLVEGHDVVGVDNLSSGATANLDRALRASYPRAGRFSLVQRDIQSPELVDIVAGVNPEVVFHLAAQADPAVSVVDPQLDARSNVLGTINLCEASRRAGIRRIVYATSDSARYNTTRLVPASVASPAPLRSPYEAAKLAGELYLVAYAEMYGLAPICLALAGVYGPRQNLCGDAGATRDRVHVDDVVEAFVRAGRAPTSVTGTYYIGSSEPRDNTMYSGRAKQDLGWTPAVRKSGPLGEGARRAS